MLSDFRHAFRSLSRTPAFTAVAVLTLALAIGANTAIFSVIDAVLLRPLPFSNPQQLVAIWEKTAIFGSHYSAPAFGNYVSWKQDNRSFSSMGCYEKGNALLENRGRYEEARAGLTTTSLFKTLGTTPALGRAWGDDEELPGAPATVILSHAFWRTHFSSDPTALGQTLSINGKTHTVIGVMPEGFGFPDADVALWLPMGSVYPASTWQDRGRHNFFVVGRLKPGVTLSEANADLATIADRLKSEYPQTNADVGAFASPLNEHISGPVRPLYLILFAAVVLLLLTACANIANMLLARMAHRRHEIAVRIALGASRWHILRRSLAESALLGLFGGGLGVLLALFSLVLLQPLVPHQLAALAPLGLDLKMIGFAFAVAMASVLIVGCLPVFPATRLNVSNAMKQGFSLGGLSISGKRTQAVLVGVQLAMSLTLLIGAGLLIRTFDHLRSEDLGFDRERVLLIRLSQTGLWSTKYRVPAARHAYYREVLQRIQALPGVRSAGFTSGAPLDVKGDMSGIFPEHTTPSRPPGGSGAINNRVVSPDYLKALGLPLLRGRHLAQSDTSEGAFVAVINEAMARHFWPDLEDPLGQRFRFWRENGPLVTVVGVVANVKQKGIDLPAAPEVYFSCYQHPGASWQLLVRTTTEPNVLAPALRNELAAIAPAIPVTQLSTMDAVVGRELSGRQLQTGLLSAFSALSLLVAALGLYGVVSYAVTCRTREFGIRSALGARPVAIIVHVLRDQLRLLIPAMVVGLLIAAALTRLMAGLLYGVQPFDPTTFAVAAILMMGTALLACWLPARRAARINPTEALRAE